jgi:Na+/H+-dicarboxylate symporter
MFIANLGGVCFQLFVIFLLAGVCFQLFVIFLLAFRRFKNWMTLKARSWKHFFMSFSTSRFLSHPAFGSPES